MPTNNFKKLMEEEQEQSPQVPPSIEREVMGSARTIRLMSDMVELYLPRLFNIFVAMLGGNRDSDHANKRNRPSARGNNAEQPPGGPTS